MGQSCMGSSRDSRTLRCTLEEEPACEIDVLAVESDHLTDVHSSDLEQGRRPSEASPVEAVSGASSTPASCLPLLLLSRDRGRPVGSDRKYIGGWHPGAVVDEYLVPREATHDRETVAKPAWDGALGERRPGEREFDRDHIGTHDLAVRDELSEQLPGTLELEAQRAPQGQVVLAR